MTFEAEWLVTAQVWRLLDLRHTGALDVFAIHYFFRARPAPDNGPSTRAGRAGRGDAVAALRRRRDGGVVSPRWRRGVAATVPRCRRGVAATVPRCHRVGAALALRLAALEPPAVAAADRAAETSARRSPNRRRR